MVFGWLAPLGFADGISPAYLEVTEQPEGRLEITWKVPFVNGQPAGIVPVFPAEYKQVSPTNQIVTKDSVIRRWDLIAETIELAGQQIGIEYADATAADVLVRVKLKDGTTHRLVLRPGETLTEVPLAESEKTDISVKAAALKILKFRFLLVFFLGFVVTLFTKPHRRRFLLPLLALGIGALLGHTAGTFTAKSNRLYDKMPSEGEYVRILHGLLLNTYRSCHCTDEEIAYDRLAKSVTGDLLTSVYLENRNALNMDEAEGATSNIDRVDVRTVTPVKDLDDGAFSVLANWDVYGSVSHWEHTHYRCNSYRAVLTLIPSQNYWKISNIEIQDEERIL